MNGFGGVVGDRGFCLVGQKGVDRGFGQVVVVVLRKEFNEPQC